MPVWATTQPTTSTPSRRRSKIAVPDRIAYGGDPNFMDVPVAGLLTKEYARSRRSLMNHKRASTVIGERYTENPPEDAILAGTPSVLHHGRDHPLSRRRMRRRYRGQHHPDSGSGFRLRRGGREHRHPAEQQHRPDGHRRRQRQPPAGPAGQASGKQHGPDSGVQGRTIRPFHRHSRQLRHPPDNNADGAERAGVRDERAGGRRGGALPGYDRHHHQHGGAGVGGSARGADQQGPRPESCWESGEWKSAADTPSAATRIRGF